MAASPSRRASNLALSIVIALTAAIALLGYRRLQNAATESAAAPRSPGFRDLAVDSNIDFQMRFLPNEQGEKFKVNLYDHGCGVAVADYDGDGDDDVLFLNQLGPNALYRNRGDGTFENVTEQAGPLAMNDRIKV